MITDINLLVEQCGDDSERWFPKLATDTEFMALAAAGEVGELCNLVKKVKRGTHTLDELSNRIAEEAMDAIIYLFNILDIEGQDAAALYERIRNNNVKRFSHE